MTESIVETSNYKGSSNPGKSSFIKTLIKLVVFILIIAAGIVVYDNLTKVHSIDYSIDFPKEQIKESKNVNFINNSGNKIFLNYSYFCEGSCTLLANVYLSKRIIRCFTGEN